MAGPVPIPDALRGVSASVLEVRSLSLAPAPTPAPRVWL